MTELRSGDAITSALRLVRPLGQGGMGRVWIAEHAGLRTEVVVKFMSEELASNPEALARFSREAAAAAQVKSPHVVHISDYGLASNGAPFIAMELLEGQDLRHLLDQRRVLAPAEVVAIITQAARALMAAHQRGIVHRDIKPENIFLTDAGGGELFVKVLDFGVAKTSQPGALRESATTMKHTKAGTMLGTPAYMSPEQVLGLKTIDYRSDLWALGVVAYEAMTGRLPFDGETVGALSVAICGGTPLAPSQIIPALGPKVDAWFARACARDVEARFQSARELADALAAAVGGASRTSGSPDESQKVVVAPATKSVVSGFEETNDNPRVGGGPPAARVTTNGAISQRAIASSSRTTSLGWARGHRLAVGITAAAILGAVGGVVVFLGSRDPAPASTSEPARRRTASPKETSTSASDTVAPTPSAATTTPSSEASAVTPAAPALAKPPAPKSSTSPASSASSPSAPIASASSPTVAPAPKKKGNNEDL